MEVLWFVVVGIAAGWAARVVMKGGGFGLAGDLVVGVVGALVGGLMYRSLVASAGGGPVAAVTMAAAGAILLLLLVRLIRRV
jgi:uncharacterized membrane protein YeaQ/YmgE (transglycosylase-associated protein family)